MLNSVVGRSRNSGGTVFFSAVVFSFQVARSIFRQSKHGVTVMLIDIQLFATVRNLMSTPLSVTLFSSLLKPGYSRAEIFSNAALSSFSVVTRGGVVAAGGSFVFPDE